MVGLCGYAAAMLILPQLNYGFVAQGRASIERQGPANHVHMAVVFKLHNVTADALGALRDLALDLGPHRDKAHLWVLYDRANIHSPRYGFASKWVNAFVRTLTLTHMALAQAVD